MAVIKILVHQKRKKLVKTGNVRGTFFLTAHIFISNLSWRPGLKGLVAPERVLILSNELYTGPLTGLFKLLQRSHL